MGHPAADTLVGLVEGRLDPEAAAGVHTHVRDCNDCRLVLAGMAESSPPAADDEEKPLVPGEKAGRFVLDKLLGIGGMGAVWAASDPELGRSVAIKILRAGVGSDGDRAQARRRLM